MNDERDYTVPRTDSEKRAAAGAIHKEEQLTEMDALVEQLTERERLFIQFAYELGVREERKRLTEGLSNPQAVTLDAREVSNLISTNALRNLDPRNEFEIRRMIGGQHFDRRLQSLCRAVDQILKKEGG